MNSSLAQRTGYTWAPGLTKAAVFGTELNCSSFDETLRSLDQHIDASDQKSPCVVLTANVDHVLRLRSSESFASAYRSADWVTIDGMPLLWATQLLGHHPPERVTGIDLLGALLSLAEHRGLSCYFLGAKEQVLASCIDNVQRMHPQLRIAGARSGYFSDDAEIVSQINRCEPDLLFVGMGSPRQELWVAKNKQSLCCRLVLPVGGSFDVLAGRISRAPKTLQRLGLEWTWRLALEPRRLWRRYLLEGPKFLALTYTEFRRHGQKGK